MDGNNDETQNLSDEFHEKSFSHVYDYEAEQSKKLPVVEVGPQTFQIAQLKSKSLLRRSYSLLIANE
jgi:hypothetical protein